MGTPKITRKHVRIPIDAEAVLLFPAHQAHPRIRAHLFQISKGGCAVTTTERLFIGEECRIWATSGGVNFLEVSGRVVWMKTVYEGIPHTTVGMEFNQEIDLTDELLERLKAKKP
jgi:hypothetical protein